MLQKVKFWHVLLGFGVLYALIYPYQGKASGKPSSPRLGFAQTSLPYSVGCGSFTVVFRDTPRMAKTITLRAKQNLSFGNRPSSQSYLSLILPARLSRQQIFYCLRDRLQPAVVHISASYRMNGIHFLPAVKAQFDPKGGTSTGDWSFSLLKLS